MPKFRFLEMWQRLGGTCSVSRKVLRYIDANKTWLFSGVAGSIVLAIPGVIYYTYNDIWPLMNSWVAPHCENASPTDDLGGHTWTFSIQGQPQLQVEFDNYGGLRASGVALRDALSITDRYNFAALIPFKMQSYYLKGHFLPGRCGEQPSCDGTLEIVGGRAPPNRLTECILSK